MQMGERERKWEWATEKDKWENSAVEGEERHAPLSRNRWSPEEFVFMQTMQYKLISNV